MRPIVPGSIYQSHSRAVREPKVISIGSAFSTGICSSITVLTIAQSWREFCDNSKSMKGRSGSTEQSNSNMTVIVLYPLGSAVDLENALKESLPQAVESLYRLISVFNVAERFYHF